MFSNKHSKKSRRFLHNGTIEGENDRMTTNMNAIYFVESLKEPISIIVGVTLILMIVLVLLLKFTSKMTIKQSTSKKETKQMSQST